MTATHRTRLLGGLVFALSFAIALPAAAGAAADDGSLAPYFEMDGHAVRISAPGVERFGSVAHDNSGPGTRHIDSESEIEGWGGGFDTRIGFDVPRDLLPGWQMEFAASYAKMNEHSTDRTVLNDFPGDEEDLFGLPVDGSIPPDLSMALMNGLGDRLGHDGQQVISSFDGEFSMYDLRLQVAKPTSFLGLLEEKVRVGLLGGQIDQDYEIQQHARDGFNGYRSTQDLQEQAESWFIGPVFGVAFAVALTDLLRLSVELETALLYHEADLTAQQQFTVGFGGSDSAVINFTETADESNFNSRSRIEGNLDWDFGWALLGVGAAFTYSSYAPEVVNPRGVRDFSVLTTEPGPVVRLSSGDMHILEVGARLTIPFGN